jgi:hypothetical protein
MHVMPLSGFQALGQDRREATSATSQAIGSVTGLQSFSWKNVAAGAVASGANYGSNQLTTGWGSMASRVAGGVSAGVASASVRGNLSQSWAGIAQDVVGSTIGNSIAERLAQGSLPPIDVDMQRPVFSLEREGLGVGDVTVPGSAAAYAVSGGAEGVGRTQSGALSSDGIPTLPTVVVTPNERFNEDYLNLWQWSVLNNRPAVPATTSQGVLNQYRHEQYLELAPAYAQWKQQTFEGRISDEQLMRNRIHLMTPDQRNAYYDASYKAWERTDTLSFLKFNGSLMLGGALGAAAAASATIAAGVSAYGLLDGGENLYQGIRDGNTWQAVLGGTEGVLSAFGLAQSARAIFGTGTVASKVTTWNEWRPSSEVGQFERSYGAYLDDALNPAARVSGSLQDEIDALGRIKANWASGGSSIRQSRIASLAEVNAGRYLSRLQDEARKLDPSSHFSLRHGFQTTLEKQFIRATTGLTPDGIQQSFRSDSSLFLSARAELSVLQRAESINRLTGRPVVNLDMREVIGDGFTKLRSNGTGLDYVVTTRARVVFKNGVVHTQFPVLRP